MVFFILYPIIYRMKFHKVLQIIKQTLYIALATNLKNKPSTLLMALQIKYTFAFLIVVLSLS